jgi:hypothetical protein
MGSSSDQSISSDSDSEDSTDTAELVGVLKKKNETGVSEARQSLLRQVHRTIKLHLTEASSTAEDGRQSKYRKKKGERQGGKCLVRCE